MPPTGQRHLVCATGSEWPPDSSAAVHDRRQHLPASLGDPPFRLEAPIVKSLALPRRHGVDEQFKPIGT
jgi:hypothetical protein